MTPGVPFPSNPIPVGRDCGEDCRGCKARDRWSEGWTAADSWWRSRLVSDEAVRVAARKVRAAITAESLTWDTVVRVAFAALLPVAGGSGGRSAPGNFRAANLPAEKPETDT